jgi:hypothetical protein
MTAHVFNARFVVHVFVHVNVSVNILSIHVQLIIFEFHISIIFQLYIMSLLVNSFVNIQYVQPLHFTVIVHVCHSITISVPVIVHVGQFSSLYSITFIVFDRSVCWYRYQFALPLICNCVSHGLAHV